MAQKLNDFFFRWPVRFGKLILVGLKLKENMAPGDYCQPIMERTALQKKAGKTVGIRVRCKTQGTCFIP